MHQKMPFMKYTLYLIIALFPTQFLQSQVSAKLMRFPDVSADHIAFVYGGDIWLAPKDGGTAMQVTHSPGEESWPRFSPDGRLPGRRDSGFPWC